MEMPQRQDHLLHQSISLRLNPSFDGNASTALDLIALGVKEVGLNPSFDGNASTANKAKTDKRLLKVLILLLMEMPQRLMTVRLIATLIWS